MPADGSRFDDGPHFFGVKRIAVNEVHTKKKGKGGMDGIQITYREDGEGEKYGEEKSSHDERVTITDLEDREEIVSVTVIASVKMDRLQWIKFVTTAGREISFGDIYAKSAKKSAKHYESATYEAPDGGYILGGIYGLNSQMAMIGVYWVKKSPIRRVRGGNILIGPGSCFLQDETITEKVPDVTTISEALAWIKQDTMSELGSRNPVILFQIDETGLVAHRKRFLEQLWLKYPQRLTAAEFAELTISLVASQADETTTDECMNAGEVKKDHVRLPSGRDLIESVELAAVNVYYIVGEECDGAATEGSACTTGQECSSGFCDSNSCVHKLPPGGICVNNVDCDLWLSCSDAVCIEAPSSSPSAMPSSSPSVMPSSLPSAAPSDGPSTAPSSAPSAEPSVSPSSAPSAEPSASPSSQPSSSPSALPSDVPSLVPSNMPSALPSDMPSLVPSSMPSSFPSSAPTVTVRAVTCFGFKNPRVSDYSGYEFGCLP
jgi:hypothetical protein